MSDEEFAVILKHLLDAHLVVVDGEVVGNWTDEHINGIRRFIRKITVWLSERGDDTADVETLKKQVFAYTESFKFNKVVSSFMIFLNENKHKRLNDTDAQQIISLLEIYMPSFRTKLKEAQYV